MLRILFCWNNNSGELTVSREKFNLLTIHYFTLFLSSRQVTYNFAVTVPQKNWILQTKRYLVRIVSDRSSRPEVFLIKYAANVQENTHAKARFQWNCFAIESALRHECSPLNLLYIYRTFFSKNTSGRLILFRRLFRTQSNICDEAF